MEEGGMKGPETYAPVPVPCLFQKAIPHFDGRAAAESQYEDL